MSYRQRATFGSTFVVRTTLEPTAIAEQVRDTIRALDPELPISNLRTQREQIDLSLRRERLFAQLATLLGGVALLLATIGLYGLLAYSVTRRTPELGLRMALGADRGTVRWMVLKQSLILVGAGLAIGIPARDRRQPLRLSLLFEISPSSPLALAAAAGDHARGVAAGRLHAGAARLARRSGDRARGVEARSGRGVVEAVLHSWLSWGSPPGRVGPPPAAASARFARADG